MRCAFFACNKLAPFWEVFTLNITDTETLVRMLLLQAVLIAVNAVFTCAETAVISMNDARLDKLAAEKNKKAVRLKKLTDKPSKFLTTVHVIISFAAALGSAFAAYGFSGALSAKLSVLGLDKYMSPEAIKALAVVIITAVLLYVTLIFGELVPKRAAVRKCEQTALRLSRLLSVASVIAAPFAWILTKSANGVLRLIGIDPNEEDDEVTEEEIRMMVDAGTEKGTIDSDEKEFIQNVFEFDDTDVGEICTHRKDVEILWMEDDMELWAKTINASRHTKFPVCKENTDDVIGVLDVKDYFRISDKSRRNVMTKCVEEPHFVLETTKADVMFEQMKKSRNYFAVVLDEYGGMCGIITLNDLVQQIMGEFLNEGEEYLGEEIEKIGDNKWKIMGEASLKDVCEELDVSISDEDYDTFGGFIFGCLGSIPDDGSCFEIEANGMKINVDDVKNHCVVNAYVSLITGEEAAAADEE